MVEFPAPWPLPHEHVLLQELNHRINNEFTAAISVVSLAATSSRNDEVKTALTAVEEMLHHHAHVHRALQMPEHDNTVLDAEAYLSRLCLSISRSYLDNRNIKLSLVIEPLLLPADRSWLLGMIVYELILNAAQHAFDGRGGEIRVAVSRDAEFVKCIVQDNGSATSSNIQPGRGLKIVTALSNVVGGRFKQTFGSHGSTSVLIFPGAGEPQQTSTSATLEALSARENDILKLIADGLSNKEIARNLAIAPETVKSHVKNIFTKLNVERRAQAVSCAQTLGLAGTD